MNMMTNLSASGFLSENGAWLPIAVVAVVAVLALVIYRRVAAGRAHTDKISDQVDAVQGAGSADDAMMAAMIGAIKANEEQGAVLAAITAAIAVVWASEHPGTGFRVVSYRHVEKRAPWNAR